MLMRRRCPSQVEERPTAVPRSACGWRWGVVAAVFLSVVAVSGAPAARLLRSSTGQFVVSAPSVLRDGRGPALTADTNAPVLIELEASALLLTCERVKKALLWELGVAADRWSGTIYVVVNPAIENGRPPFIGAQAFTGGWQYRMELPRQIAPLALLRGIVQVTLMEMANRAAGTRSAEVPLWLSEGFTLHLARTSLIDIVVTPPREVVNRVHVRSVIRDTKRPDPLAQARDRLQSHAAMGVSRLGDITPDDLAGETWLTFQASAQLFVHSLLQLPGGRACLYRTVHQLAAYYNWQSAFLASFSPGFTSMLDVEKWWSVTLFHFAGQDPMNAWSAKVAAGRLEDVLRPPVLVSQGRADLPRRTRVPLQQMIREWDFPRQRPVIQGVTAQLMAMRVKLPPEQAHVADQYRAVLTDYLEDRLRLARARPVVLAPTGAAIRLVEETAQKLARLDQARAAAGQPAAEPAKTEARPGAGRR